MMAAHEKESAGMKRDSLGLRSVVFIDGCRVPFLRAGTDYRDLMSYDLARLAIKGLLRRTKLDPGKVNWVILGTTIANVQTSNVARDAALGAGLPPTVGAHTVTIACISANRAITDGVDLIRTGQADVIIAGGTDSVSDIPIRYRKRFRQKLLEARGYKKAPQYLNLLRGLSLSDILPEIPSVSEFSTGRTMGQDCERLTSRLGVTRLEQDEFAVRSHTLAARATAEGLLGAEIEPVHVPPHFKTIDRDNGIRGDTTLEAMGKLRPAFEKPYGTLTAGNSSFLTDGAAAVLIMAEEKAAALGLRPRARFVAHAYTAQDPGEELLLGPAYAIPRALAMAGMTLSDIDVFEIHEAFAGQILANLKCLASDSFAKEKLGRGERVGEIPLDRLNTLGGSLSLGHPFGATGARLVTTAVSRLVREKGRSAIVAACAGGAHGNATILERCE
jgi:acetyl-CoA acetyltransferase family protein